jgi:hypothetical protein
MMTVLRQQSLQDMISTINDQPVKHAGLCYMP